MILIVPCYNEQERIPVDEYVADAKLFDAILFVDDGSTDNTHDVLEQIQRKVGPQQCLIKTLDNNVGKGEAVRQGILHYFDVLAPGNAENSSSIGITDADLSTPLKEMHRLGSLHEQLNLDLCQGSRVALIGRTIKRSYIKHYLGRVAATLISELLDLPIYDTQAGAKVISVRVAQDLFKAPFISRWLFDCELYLRARQANLVIYEEPLTCWIDSQLGSKINFRAYAESLLDLAKIYKKYKCP